LGRGEIPANQNYDDPSGATLRLSCEIKLIVIWIMDIVNHFYSEWVLSVLNMSFDEDVSKPVSQESESVLDTFKLLSKGQTFCSELSWLERKRGASISVYECLDRFMRLEQLGEENMWYCGTCKKHQQAYKKMDIWKLPKILVIHLKRFAQADRYTRSKCESLVTFPHSKGDCLDMSTYVLEKAKELAPFVPKYEIFGVSRHCGGLGGGHYTADVKCRLEGDNSRWYHFDDTRVSLQEDSMETNDAYLLFYEATNV